jgi:hypothetical protein
MKGHYEIAIQAMQSLELYRTQYSVTSQEYKEKAQGVIETLQALRDTYSKIMSPAVYGFFEGFIQALLSEIRANG